MPLFKVSCRADTTAAAMTNEGIAVQALFIRDQHNRLGIERMYVCMCIWERERERERGGSGVGGERNVEWELLMDHACVNLP